MDFFYNIDLEFYIVFKYYVWNNIFNMYKFYNCYSFMGIGQESDGMFGFFDGVNEKGFVVVVLYFVGYVKYKMFLNYIDKEFILFLDFFYYILGKCGLVKEFKEILLDIYIVGFEDLVI